MNISVILPSYNPNEQMLDVIDGLLAQGFRDIIVVNDGSKDAFLEPFSKLAKYPEVTLLTHEVNKGKGRALKTAFLYCIENRPDIDGVITVDGDNQHHPLDILNCARQLQLNPHQVILGCRTFDKSIPWKSRFGNNATKLAFKVLCGVKLSDTQTGLRAIPRDLLPFMTVVPGERFEYETYMLLEMKRKKITWREVPIRTIYIEDNSETHFRPVRDSLKIYRVIFKFMFKNMLTFLKFSLGSITSFIIDIGVFFLTQWLLGDVFRVTLDVNIDTGNLLGKLLNAFLGSHGAAATEDVVATVGVYAIIATITSRVISSIYNYCYNRHVVFKNQSKNTVLKYYILAICQMFVSGLCVALLSMLTGANKWIATLIKIIVDFVLFFASYQIQRQWVFKSTLRRKAEKLNKKRKKAKQTKGGQNV